MFAVFAGRSVQWILDSVACGTIAWFVMVPLFDVELPVARMLLVVPILVAVALSVYGFALVLGGLVLRRPELRGLTANVSVFVVMLFTGVQVPLSFWPGPEAAAANLLPMTHGLRAVRAIFDGADATAVAAAGAELGVGLGWFLVAALVFRRLAEGGRRDGSIEFGS